MCRMCEVNPEQVSPLDVIEMNDGRIARVRNVSPTGLMQLECDRTGRRIVKRLTDLQHIVTRRGTH